MCDRKLALVYLLVIQDIMADVRNIMNETFSVSFCGSAANVPVMAPLAALQASGDMPLPELGPNVSTTTTLATSSVTPS